MEILMSCTMKGLLINLYDNNIWNFMATEFGGDASWGLSERMARFAATGFLTFSACKA